MIQGIAAVATIEESNRSPMLFSERFEFEQPAGVGAHWMTRASVAQFREQGYLSLDRALDPEAIAEVRALLDPLFARFHELPAAAVQDLAGARASPPDRLRSPEINRAVRIEPRLAHTTAFAVCRELASELLGRSVGYSFDHSIYKQPFNESETPWHQDQIYTGHRTSLGTVHFWIPLQDATCENGCMNFIPGSHRRGLLRHARPDLNAPTRSLVDAGDLVAKAVACPLSVGGLTVHTPLTIHYTGPNLTSEPRRVWIVHFGPFGRWAKLHPRVLAERVLGRLGVEI